MYILNWVFFFAIIIYVYKAKRKNIKEKRKSDIRRDVKMQLFLAVGMAVLFGLGWGVGLLTTGLNVEGAKEVTFTIQLIFAIFVGLQGFFMFLLHGLRDKHIWEWWKLDYVVKHLKSRHEKFAPKTILAAITSTTDKQGTIASSTVITNASTASNDYTPNIQDAHHIYDKPRFDTYAITILKYSMTYSNLFIHRTSTPSVEAESVLNKPNDQHTYFVPRPAEPRL